MDKKQGKQIISILLLLVIVFSLGNLIYNIEHLDTRGEVLYKTAVGPAGESYPITVSSSVANTFKYVIMGIISIAFAIAIGGLAYGVKNKNKDLIKSVVFLIIGGVLAILLIYGVFYSGEGRTDPMGYNPILNPQPGDGGGGGLTGGGQGYAEPDSRNVVLAFATLAIVFSFIVLTIFAVGSLLEFRADKTFDPDEEIKSEEVARTIRKAMKDMISGTDVRSTILRCYRDIVRLASRHGVREEEHLTPREFEIRMEAKLPIEEKQLHELILLFEEARYSDHVLSEELKGKAMKLLAEINDDLAVDDGAEFQKITGEEPYG